MEKVVNEKCPTARQANEEWCKLTGDERHGFEWSEEKGLLLPTKCMCHCGVKS